MDILDIICHFYENKHEQYQLNDSIWFSSAATVCIFIYIKVCLSLAAVLLQDI